MRYILDRARHSVLFATESNEQDGALRLHASGLDGAGGCENSGYRSCVVVGAVPDKMVGVFRINAEWVSLASASLAIVMRSDHHNFLLEYRITAFDETQHIA